MNNNINNKLKKTIINILDIIEYKQDKDVLAGRLIKEFYIEAVIKLMDLIPYEKRQLFISDFSKKSDSEKEKYIFSFFTTQQISLSLENSIKHIIREYIHSVMSTFSPVQIQRLQLLKA